MILPEQRELLNTMSKSQYGVVLSAFLKEELDTLNDISKVETWEETLGKKYAIKVVKKLFSFMEEKKVGEKHNNPYI